MKKCELCVLLGKTKATVRAGKWRQSVKKVLCSDCYAVVKGIK